MYARIIRRQKTQRDVQIWNSGQEYAAAPRSSSTFSDYSQVDKQDEVKYI